VKTLQGKSAPAQIGRSGTAPAAKRGAPELPPDETGKPDAARGGKANIARTTRMRKTRDENWDQRLGFLMHDVSRLRRKVFDEFMKPLGVTRSQWWILAHLSRHDGMIQSDLATVLEIGKAALGGLIERLESAEMVERRPDVVDRRAKRVYLSPKGTRLISEMRAKSNEMSERMLGGLSVKDRLVLADMLTQVKLNLLSAAREQELDTGESDEEADDTDDTGRI
jgi:DNA-binding MarR family transcriptional regulator